MCNYVFISFTTLYKKNGDIRKNQLLQIPLLFRWHKIWLACKIIYIDVIEATAYTYTYFASPADALPDTEIDQHPCNGECDS